MHTCSGVVFSLEEGMAYVIAAICNWVCLELEVAKCAPYQMCETQMCVIESAYVFCVCVSVGARVCMPVYFCKVVGICMCVILSCEIYSMCNLSC